MSNINNDYIEEYIRGLLPEKKNSFKEMEMYAQENHIPIIEPEVAQFLTVQLKSLKPNSILEIGTAIGYSALVFAKALDGNCTITTIERRVDMIELALKNITDSDYRKNIKILQGEAEEILPKLKEKYDLIFIDAAKGQYLEFFNEALKLLNSNGMIISDNVLFRGMVATDDLVIRRKKTIVKRLRGFLKYINEIEGYSSCVIPIGDGIALTYKEM
ncbi:O-methyltransferase [Tissierella creatinophila]|uniref:tRNA 5-hydroxyuridine methyltransferase n=1 Tax=Tissierella creatinophila DSM 6911 TaxID=1123403 RepID=A0A1U7M9B9_TISCR|nr:O-methyltransferase [Tissierella creatinophila]OLS03912.1 putative O-methyltransferase [Tissierella creatinophila DSM 6911]